jgi:hypothetical protein
MATQDDKKPAKQATQQKVAAKPVVKKDVKPKPLTPSEQLRANKAYKDQGGKLQPGQNAKIVEGDEDNFRKGVGTIAFNEPDPVKPKEQPKAAVVKQEPAKVEPAKPAAASTPSKPKVDYRPPIKKVRPVPEEKPVPEDFRGYRKKRKDPNERANIVAKTTYNLTGVQSLRRAAELAANRLLEKSGSGLRFKKALKTPLRGK